MIRRSYCGWAVASVVSLSCGVDSRAPSVNTFESLAGEGPASDAGEIPMATATCASGERRCGERRIEHCLDGAFTIESACEGSCILSDGAPTCVTTCVPGTARCTVDGASVRVCGEDQTWGAAESCPGGCADGRCLTCQPGVAACTEDGAGVMTCSEAGEWVDGGPCPLDALVCFAGECRICAAGDTRCSAEGLPQTCAVDGMGWVDGTACTGAGSVCVASLGRCGQCTPGDRRACVEALGNCAAGQQECGDAGVWGLCSVQPAPSDGCQPGDDATCDGVPNSGCTCTAAVACGPATDTGACTFGSSACLQGVSGPCEGAVSAAARDCRSGNDNDCDGVPDNRIDQICQCETGAVETCEAHAGVDGTGICRAGSRTCVEGAGNLSSRWGECVGAVGPRPRNCSSSADNDCDGVADDTFDATCQCIPGTSVSCGADIAEDCPALKRIQRCEAASNGASAAPGACTFENQGGVCAVHSLLSNNVGLASLSIDGPFLYFLSEVPGFGYRVERIPRGGGEAQSLSPLGSFEVSLAIADGSTIYGAAVASDFFGNTFNGSELGAMPILGGDFTRLEGGVISTYVGAVRSNATHFFFASTGSRSYVERLDKLGGTIELVVSSPLISYTEFEVDETFAYILSDADVSRVPVSGGAVTVLASWGATERVADIALSDGVIALASSSRLATLPVAGGRLVARDSSRAYRVAGTPGAIYYFRAVGAAEDCASGSELMRLSPGDNMVPVLVAREPGPCVKEMVADDVGVYWIAGDGVTLRNVGG